MTRCIDGEYYDNLDDIFNNLDPRVRSWYWRMENISDLKSAVTIGMNIVTSNSYKMSETYIVNKCNKQIKELEELNKTLNEKLNNDKQNIDQLKDNEIKEE